MTYDLVHSGLGYAVYKEKYYDNYFYRREGSPIYHGPFKSAYDAAESFKLQGAPGKFIPMGLVIDHNVIRVDFVGKRRL